MSSPPTQAAPRDGAGASLALAGLLALGALALLPLVIVPLDWQAQTLVAGVLALGSALLARRSRSRAITLVLIGISLFLTARYAWWRVTQTLGFGDPRYGWLDLTVSLVLLGAEVYAWTILLLGYVQTAWPLGRKPVALPPDPADWPHVDVFIPTYNEPLSVVEPTIIAALHIDWPRDKLHVHVLDDGRRPEFRAFAEQIGAHYIVRPDNRHAKAGNLNHALGVTGGDFIAIFDCDHVPARSFLQVTMGWMLRDPAIALLQTPHHFYSPDPFERNLGLYRKVPNEGELFYGVVQDGNDLWDAAFFCGSCAVMRRDALQAIGGIAVETVTEDAHTALKLQRRGWRTAYLNVPQAAGLATENLASHVGQRIRWARGMTQIFRIDNPLLGRGLGLGQRLCYLNAMAHFLFPLPRLIFLTAPLAFLLFDLRVLSAYAVTFAAYSLPHLVMANVTNSRMQGRHRHSFWSEVYETVLAPYTLLPTLLALINPRLGSFNVTAKGGLIRQAYFDRRIAWPYMLLWALNLAGLVAAGLRLAAGAGEDSATVWMTALWTVYNLIIVGAALAVARERRQLREHVRVPLTLPVSLDGQPALTVDLSDGGVALRSADGRPLVLGEAPQLTVAWQGQRHTLPLRWVAGNGRDQAMRLAFGPLALPERVHLVRLLYTRADAWLGVDEGRPGDRPLLSLGRLARLAWRGSLGMLGSLAPGRGRRPGDARAAALLLALAAGLAGVAVDPARAAPPLLPAAPAAAAAAVAPAPGSFSGRWTLGELGAREGLRLDAVQREQSLYFKVPVDRLVRSSRLELRLRSRPGALPPGLRVEVLLNGLPQGLLTPGGSAPLRLPLDELALGRENRLSFRLLGLRPQDCSGPEAPWVQLLPDATLVLDGSVLRRSRQLALLPAPFLTQWGPSAAEPVQIHLPGGPADPRLLEAAAVLASWLGSQAPAGAPRIRVSDGPLLPPGPTVVLLPGGARPDWALGLDLPPAEGPALALRPHPGDPGALLLVLTGRQGETLLQAARALALGQVPGERDSAALAEPRLPPPREAHDAPRWLSTRQPQALSELQPPEALQAGPEGYISLPFRLPPDLFVWPDRPLPLHLRLRPDPQDGGRTPLTASLNGRFAAQAPWPADGGPGPLQQTLLLDSGAVRPQDNRIDLQIGPRRGAPQDCTADPASPTDTADGSLAAPGAAVLDGSHLDLRGLPHHARLPDLALLGNGGFPYTVHADFAQSAVLLPAQPETALLGTWLSLMAHWGAQTGAVALHPQVLRPGGLGSASAGRDLLILGRATQLGLPAEWLDRLPVVEDGRGGLQARPPAPVWRRLPDWLPGAAGVPAELGPAALESALLQERRPLGSLQQIVLPQSGGRIATLLQAGSPAGWTALGQALTDGEARAGVFGQVTLVGEDQAPRSFFVDGPRAPRGALPPLTALLWQLQQQPLLVALGALGLALLQGLAAAAWLRRRARRRLEARA